MQDLPTWTLVTKPRVRNAAIQGYSLDPTRIEMEKTAHLNRLAVG